MLERDRSIVLVFASHALMFKLQLFRAPIYQSQRKYRARSTRCSMPVE